MTRSLRVGLAPLLGSFPMVRVIVESISKLLGEAQNLAAELQDGCYKRSTRPDMFQEKVFALAKWQHNIAIRSKEVGSRTKICCMP
jgi:hypothetical protein